MALSIYFLTCSSSLNKTELYNIIEIIGVRKKKSIHIRIAILSLPIQKFRESIHIFQSFHDAVFNFFLIWISSLNPIDGARTQIRGQEGSKVCVMERPWAMEYLTVKQIQPGPPAVKAIIWTNFGFSHLQGKKELNAIIRRCSAPPQVCAIVGLFICNRCETVRK